MRGNPISRQTWDVRYLLPIAQGATVLCGVGATGYAATYVLTHERPDLAWIPAALAAGTAYLVHRFEVANRQKLSTQRAILNRKHALTTTGLVLAAKEKPIAQPVASVTRAEVDPYLDWPVNLADLKFYCHKIAFRGVDLGINTWTKNSKDGDPLLKIFTPRTYKILIGKMLDRGYARDEGIGEFGSRAGRFLTKTGTLWCVEIIHTTPLHHNGYPNVTARDKLPDKNKQQNEQGNKAGRGK